MKFFIQTIILIIFIIIFENKISNRSLHLSKINQKNAKYIKKVEKYLDQFENQIKDYETNITTQIEEIKKLYIKNYK